MKLLKKLLTLFTHKDKPTDCEYSLDDFYSSVKKFQALSGKREIFENMSPEFLEAVSGQLSRIKEEVLEIEEAINSKDSKELLKEIDDTLFVVLGFIDMLELSGYHVFKSLKVVSENNISKFPKDRYSAKAAAYYYQEMGQPCEIQETTEDDGSSRYAIKRVRDGKVMKPKGFKGVDLTDLIPCRQTKSLFE